MLVNNISGKKNNGSITIEAAIVLPFVMFVCLLVFSLSSIVYNHAKVQMLLNQVCVELSYDSYMFDELGVIDVIQDINKNSIGDTLTMEDIKSFSEVLLNNPLESMSFQLSGMNDYTNPIEFIDVASSGLDIIGRSIEYSRKIKDTLVDEGLYYVTTTYGRHYVEDKLDTYLSDAGIEMDFRIEHLELFNYDDSGVVIISYEFEFPFKILKTSSIKLVNSGYIHLFSGHGNYNEKYHKDIKTSSYGSGDSLDNKDKDEDGFYKKVYITDKGVKYHKNPICFHIKVNVMPIPLSMVPTKEPCSHCVNEEIVSNNVIVFTTLASSVYHSSATCYSIYHNISILSEKEAILKGYEPCGTCSK